MSGGDEMFKAMVILMCIIAASAAAQSPSLPRAGSVPQMHDWLAGRVLRIDGTTARLLVRNNEGATPQQFELDIQQWGVMLPTEWQKEWSETISSILRDREVACTNNINVKIAIQDTTFKISRMIADHKIPTGEAIIESNNFIRIFFHEDDYARKIVSYSESTFGRRDIGQTSLTYLIDLHRFRADRRRECAIDSDGMTIASVLLQLGYYEIDVANPIPIPGRYLAAQKRAQDGRLGVWRARLVAQDEAMRLARAEQRADDAQQLQKQSQQQTRTAMVVSAIVAGGTSVLAIVGSAVVASRNDRRRRAEAGEQKDAEREAVLVALYGELSALRAQATTWREKTRDNLLTEASLDPRARTKIYDWPFLSTPVFDANITAIKFVPKAFIDRIVVICGEAARIGWQAKAVTEVYRHDIRRMVDDYDKELVAIVAQIDALLPEIDAFLSKDAGTGRPQPIPVHDSSRWTGRS